jgi:hypothetical protein
MLASTNSFKIIQGIDGVQTVACAGFMLAGSEFFFRGVRIAPEGRENFFCPPPPAEFESAPGAEPTRGGGAEIK